MNDIKKINIISNNKTRKRNRLGGKAIDSGHFIPEQNPKQVIFQLKKFFLNQN